MRGPSTRVVELRIDKFNADAWDANTISWYIVPEDGGEPKPEDVTPILSNDPKSPIPAASREIGIGAGDTIGFALTNVTGGVTGYGKNGYGKPQGSKQYYYSHLRPQNVRSTGAANCDQGRVKQAWDDNGGTSDDDDYNDAVFRYECLIKPSPPTDVRLVK